MVVESVSVVAAGAVAAVVAVAVVAEVVAAAVDVDSEPFVVCWVVGYSVVVGWGAGLVVVVEASD